MTNDQLIKNLRVPNRVVDAVLDTDTYNEVDDQFALAYFLSCPERINPVAIYAAPFNNHRSTSPKNGMERSYNEIFKVLELAKREDVKDIVYKGSESFLVDEKTPVISDAAKDLAERAMNYSPENPLYVVAIAAITNIASALLINPEIKDRIVIVWLGGHALHWRDNKEFNLFQDIAAARIVFGCGAPLIQLPCNGVVDHFTVSKPELEHWLVGKNPLSDYLAKNVIEYESAGKPEDYPWRKVIWDVTAVAWLINDNNRFMWDVVDHSPIPEYDHFWATNKNRHFFKYVYKICTPALFNDLCERLNGK